MKDWKSRVIVILHNTSWKQILSKTILYKRFYRVYVYLKDQNKKVIQHSLV